ncbi:MAG: DNA replication and repair protein RecF [Solirubrobacterales bacterium]|nr:DNA replication and repair protein RecF [Solirubrobacterales bacterium]
MQVLDLDLRDFRSHHRFNLKPGASLTVIAGPNGSGKTNILEALHFGLTGTSCRAAMDRQTIAWKESTTRVEVGFENNSVVHTTAVALQRSGEKLTTLDGAAPERFEAGLDRPAVLVFLPDRLSLITGSPTERRSHFDQLTGSLDHTSSALKASYTRALTQRNALLGSAQRTGSTPGSLSAWNEQLIELGTALIQSRDETITALSEPMAKAAASLGLTGELVLTHRPGGAREADVFRSELEERTEQDINRGFTGYGPHRAEFIFKREGHDLKSTGSQGEKRMALLSLLLAERELITQRTGSTPLLLLDDVMSELDADRRQFLTDTVYGVGQCVITATEFEHVPAPTDDAVVLVALGHPHEGGLRAA